MATAKYNWDEIKQKYFESDVIEVCQFLISFLSVNPRTAGNGTYAKATKGWRAEKDNLGKAKTEEAKASFLADPQTKENMAKSGVDWSEALLLASKQIVEKVKKGEIDKVIYETISEDGEKKTTRKLGYRPLKVQELIMIFDKINQQTGLGDELQKQIIINL